MSSAQGLAPAGLIAGSRPPAGVAPFARVAGAAALVFSAVYFASDVIELANGGFSTLQLALTYVGEAAIPLFVLGLYAAQRPRIGRLGLVAAVTYAYTFVFFTGTVSYALMVNSKDWEELQQSWGSWITVHSILMVVAGIAFGLAVLRARALPRWTGVALVAGMTLMAVSVGASEVVQTVAAGVRDLAFAGMGFALLRMSLPPERRNQDVVGDLPQP